LRRDDAPGLLFITPLLWETAEQLKAAAARLKSEGVAKLPKRTCAEGYKVRLHRWVEQQPGGAGKLDKRMHNSRECAQVREGWAYNKEWEGGAVAAGKGADEEGSGEGAEEGTGEEEGAEEGAGEVEGAEEGAGEVEGAGKEGAGEEEGAAEKGSSKGAEEVTADKAEASK